MVNGYKTSIKTEIAKELSAPELATLRGDVPIRGATSGVSCVHRGRNVTSFVSWNLLGLYGRRDIVTPMAAAVGDGGWTLGSARGVLGVSHEQAVAEATCARFFGGEDGLLFPSKNQAVLSVITTLFNESDLILAPALCQAPLADACALIGADLVALEGLEPHQLAEKRRGKRRTCLFLESVSPLYGQVSEVAQELSKAESYGGWVIVDESAALGVFGLRGAGSADIVRWHPNLLCRVVSFNLALGMAGAAVVGSTDLKELLGCRSRYLRQESPEPPAMAVGVTSAIEAAELCVLSREMAGARSKLVVDGLRLQGWKVATSDGVPIVAICLDSFKAALAIQSALLQRGILVEAIPGKSRGRDGGVVRALITTAHSEDDFQSLLEGFSVVRDRMGVNALP